MKIDRFTLVVVGVVLLLLVAAIVTVNRSSGDEAGPAEYLTDDSPETPVHNAFIALQQGDLFKAQDQYTSRIADNEKDSDYAYAPWSGDFGRYDRDDTVRRLRILSVEIDEQNPDQALVTFEVDTYANTGPFGTGSTWSSQRTVEVVREDGAWKINSAEFFY